MRILQRNNWKYWVKIFATKLLKFNNKNLSKYTSQQFCRFWLIHLTNVLADWNVSLLNVDIRILLLPASSKRIQACAFATRCTHARACFFGRQKPRRQSIFMSCTLNLKRRVGVSCEIWFRVDMIPEEATKAKGDLCSLCGFHVAEKFKRKRWSSILYRDDSYIILHIYKKTLFLACGTVCAYLIR